MALCSAKLKDIEGATPLRVAFVVNGTIDVSVLHV